MKKVNFSIATLAMLMMTKMSAFAQEGKLDVDVDINKPTEGMSGWMSNPLFWIIGALILVILIAVIARGGGNKS